MLRQVDRLVDGRHVRERALRTLEPAGRRDDDLGVAIGDEIIFTHPCIFTILENR